LVVLTILGHGRGEGEVSAEVVGVGAEEEVVVVEEEEEGDGMNGEVGRRVPVEEGWLREGAGEVCRVEWLRMVICFSHSWMKLQTSSALVRYGIWTRLSSGEGISWEREKSSKN
jgi:hypothetical protein